MENNIKWASRVTHEKIKKIYINDAKNILYNELL